MDEPSADSTPTRRPRLFRWLYPRRRAEAEQLRKEISKKIRSSGDPALRAIGIERLDSFLFFRVEHPMFAHSWRGPSYGRAFTLLSVGAIAAGVASTAISATEGAAEDLRWVLFTLGLVVAVFTAINQLWKPSQRSVGAYRAANRLRRGSWDYVLGRGAYRGLSEQQAFERFLDEVAEIHARVEAIDELEPEGAPSYEQPAARSGLDQ